MSSILFSYVNAKGTEIKGLLIIPASRFRAWQWFGQQCLRFLAAYDSLGSDNMRAVLSGFGQDGLEFDHPAFDYYDYEGSRCIRFAIGKDNSPLSFGRGKAKTLLTVIDSAGGMEKFVGLCRTVAADKEVWSPKKAKGTPKKAGKPKVAGKAPSGPATAPAKRVVESIQPAPQAAPVTSQAPSRPIPTDTAALVAAWGAKGHVVLA